MKCATQFNPITSVVPSSRNFVKCWRVVPRPSILPPPPPPSPPSAPPTVHFLSNSESASSLSVASNSWQSVQIAFDKFQFLDDDAVFFIPNDETCSEQVPMTRNTINENNVLRNTINENDAIYIDNYTYIDASASFSTSYFTSFLSSSIQCTYHCWEDIDHCETYGTSTYNCAIANDEEGGSREYQLCPQLTPGDFVCCSERGGVAAIGTWPACSRSDPALAITPFRGYTPSPPPSSPIIYGCTDSRQLGYNPAATHNDDSQCEPYYYMYFQPGRGDSWTNSNGLYMMADHGCHGTSDTVPGNLEHPVTGGQTNNRVRCYHDIWTNSIYPLPPVGSPTFSYNSSMSSNQWWDMSAPAKCNRDWFGGSSTFYDINVNCADTLKLCSQRCDALNAAGYGCIAFSFTFATQPHQICRFYDTTHCSISGGRPLCEGGTGRTNGDQGVMWNSVVSYIRHTFSPPPPHPPRPLHPRPTSTPSRVASCSRRWLRSTPALSQPSGAAYASSSSSSSTATSTSSSPAL